jgi:hypothetical protein
MELDRKNGVEVPEVVSCRTDELEEPLARWRKANPGVMMSWFLKQALWEALTREGFVGKRDHKPA